MNRDRIIKLTSHVAVITALVLLYWVFIYVVVDVFGLKVFRKNITQTFEMSILGILAVLSGALIVNLVLNLSKIGEVMAQRAGAPSGPKEKMSRLYPVLFVLLFPVLFLLLYAGDLASTAKKKNLLLQSAHYVATESRADFERMADYSFDSAYVTVTGKALTRISREYEGLFRIAIIIEEKVGEGRTFLLFTGAAYWHERVRDTVEFVYSGSQEERAYLRQVFAGGHMDPRFSAHDGFYELYYPIETASRIVVLYLSTRGSFGKLGY
jgi:hypothetical protein